VGPALVAAVLPGSRSVQVGATATAFASIVNHGASPATGCRITPATAVPADSVYQTTDPTTNTVTGAASTPVTIPAASFQSFVIAFTPTAAFAPTDLRLTFVCDNAAAAPSATHSFFLFVRLTGPPPFGTGDVTFDPATNRVFVRVRDEHGVIRGSASTAVYTRF
jgi:hypothetical protein